MFNKLMKQMQMRLKKPETWVFILIAYIVYNYTCEKFIQPSLRSPVSAIPTERFGIQSGVVSTAGQAAKVTVVSTNLSAQRRGLLPPILKGGQTRDTKNIWQGLRAPPVRSEKFGNGGQIWNASDLHPEPTVKNRYL